MKQDLIRKAIADPAKNLLTFIFFSYVLGVATNGLSVLILNIPGKFLEHALIISPELAQGLVALGVTLLTVLGIYLTDLSGWFRILLIRLGFATNMMIERVNTIKLLDQEVSTCKGLIVFVSLSDAPPAEVVIRHHWGEGSGNLRHCWLICSDQSFEKAEILLDRLKDDGVTDRVRFHYGFDYLMKDLNFSGKPISLVLRGNEIDDPNAVRRLVDCIYADAAKYGLQESEVIADYTGGIKSMTAGMVLACTDPGRRLEYLRSQYTANNQIDASQSPEVVEVLISYKLVPMKSAQT